MHDLWKTDGHSRQHEQAATMQAWAASESVSFHKLQRLPAEGQLVQRAPHKGLVQVFKQCVLVQGVGLMYGAALALRPGWHAPQLLQNGFYLVQEALHQPAPRSSLYVKCPERQQTAWGTRVQLKVSPRRAPLVSVFSLQGAQLGQEVLHFRRGRTLHRARVLPARSAARRRHTPAAPAPAGAARSGYGRGRLRQPPAHPRTSAAAGRGPGAWPPPAGPVRLTVLYLTMLVLVHSEGL